MGEISFQGRSLAYSTFGSVARFLDAPSFVVLSTEYRDTTTVADFYAQFPGTIGGVVLDNTNMGQSSRLERPLTPEEVLAEVRCACSGLGIRHPVIVGYCSNAELALYVAHHLGACPAVLQSPLVRQRDSGFIDFFYGAMKKAILSADAYMLAVVMNLVDPHGRGFREDRNYFLSDQFALAAFLREPEHFWVKTQQNKPVGRFEWEKMREFAGPALVLRGTQDPIQPISFLRSCLTEPRHELVEVDNSHRLLEDRLDEVIDHMSVFAASLPRPECAVRLEA
ncbi:hypothetical protein AB838_06225 [Rhodobacteraceae bacterium (ex Bugula neritina AB1)]|nr:hypothetical protein AB838_06225 [Rhodobacteraceae bacterium (ex Bugula neritina AB1)]